MISKLLDLFKNNSSRTLQTLNRHFIFNLFGMNFNSGPESAEKRTTENKMLNTGLVKADRRATR